MILFKKTLLLLLFTLLNISQPILSATVELPKPGPKDTCPVCGMFVAKYPEWVATVRYKDGHAHHFDGTKDLFKYLLNLPKWAPGDKGENIDSIGVTEYYGLTLIDGREAFYVVGSDVLGPMGHELIPVESKEDEEGFLRDHQGTAIIRFNQVAVDLLLKLDSGVFE